ncbi:MAG: hypothetical protein HN909_03805, partial [Phycisphaerales bacterium]|nr:hypothetical protein [Phycisphaerales bacterium]
KTIGVENGDTMFAWFMSVMALGCLAGPLIGMVADRFFAAERVLATLNIAAAALFIVTAIVSAPLSNKMIDEGLVIKESYKSTLEVPQDKKKAIEEATKGDSVTVAKAVVAEAINAGQDEIATALKNRAEYPDAIKAAREGLDSLSKAVDAAEKAVAAAPEAVKGVAEAALATAKKTLSDAKKDIRDKQDALKGYPDTLKMLQADVPALEKAVAAATADSVVLTKALSATVVRNIDSEIKTITKTMDDEIDTKTKAMPDAYSKEEGAGFIQQNLPMVVFILLLLQMCCYMPTWGLATVVAMGHLSSEQFARVRIFGSIGWVAAGLVSVIAMKGFGVEVFDGSVLPLYAAAGVGILGALIALTIPKTAPAAKGQPMSIIDALGLRTLSMFKDYNFMIFIVLSILGTVAFATHFNFTQVFLQAKGFKYITVTQNWGQAFEVVIMGVLPLMLAWLGFRKAMIVGLAVQALRYGAFYLAAGEDGSQLALYGGIIAHGIIYSFIYVGGQIYIDKKAPEAIRGQAQGFYFLATFGIGMIIGNFTNAWLMDVCKDEAGVTQWAPFYKYVAIYSAALVPAMWLLFRDKLKGGQQETIEEKEAIVEEELSEHPVV